MTYIHITFTGALSNLEEQRLRQLDAIIGQSNSMLGGETTVNIVIAFTPIVLKGLKDIIIQLSKDRRKITIKIPGFEITDIDKKTAKKFMEEVMVQVQEKKHKINE